ncbi:GDSL esterase/lipase At5g03610-like [Alnus glutinosa]|uniref:GDSL esterase/lipase At5g03610-like n=1 Tax=Alnus glutinosa TaxID=3517 RepID=UPI002D76E9D5|nr:GDSL esterase/lipase At5g03610-like [Alnus glutinosa]
MDTQKLLYSILCYFLLSLLSGQQVVQGHLAHHHHHSFHRQVSNTSKLFVFGDSYADTGNTAKSDSPSWKDPYGITFPGKPTGRFSNGRVLTDYFAKSMGIGSPIPYRRWKFEIPLLKYGMNFALGGTGVYETSTQGPTMTTQIDSFQNVITDNVFNISDIQSSVTLVTLSGNDYLAYIRNHGTEGIQSFIPKVVKQLSVNLKRIHGLGVKKVAVAGLPPVGCLPAFTATSSFRQCNATMNLLVISHNHLLKQAVAQLNNETKDSTFIILDLYASFTSVIDNNGSRKFENPLKPCCFGVSSKYSCGSVDESGAKKYTLCEDPESAFFWDILHPTQAGWSAVYPALQATLQQLF